MSYRYFKLDGLIVRTKAEFEFPFQGSLTKEIIQSIDLEKEASDGTWIEYPNHELRLLNSGKIVHNYVPISQREILNVKPTRTNNLTH